MRRIVIIPLALIAAACHDQPTGIEPAGPSLAKSPAAGAVAPITVVPSAPRSLGYTNGDVYRYPNLPEPDVGGDRVVWRWAASPYYGDASIFQAQLPSGTAAELSSGANSGPRTSGRYTTWQDGTSTIVVLDNTTGQRRRIEGQWPLALSVEAAGDRLAYLDVTAQTVMLYDIRTGEQRVITRWGTDGAPYNYVRDIGFDGRYLALIADGGMGSSGLGMVVHDTWTGTSRVAVPFGQGYMTGPSVDRGRVVFSMDVAGGGHPVFLYDIASGTTRQLSSNAPRAQTNPEISGDLVVWDDTRQDQQPAYVYNHDVYLYDLAAGMEMPLASGPEWTSNPRVDGGRVVYTERRNNRWEVMLVELVPVTLPALREELRRMTASGAVRNAGVARSLEQFLSQAASAQAAGNRARTEHWLRQFADQVRRHAGRQIDAAAARRLEGMAAGVIARM